MRADIIERIMCDFRVDLQQVCARHGKRPESLLRSADRLDMLIADGIVQLEGPVLSVADNTRHLVRSVAAAFDAYLKTSGPVYSRAV
jgi:oxygen-independent coproporphyrinogen-3 oxidase